MTTKQIQNLRYYKDDIVSLLISPEGSIGVWPKRKNKTISISDKNHWVYKLKIIPYNKGDETNCRNKAI